MTRWNIRLDALWRPLLLIIGARPSTCYVELDDARMLVRFGLFSADVPVAEIHGGRRIKWPLYYGIGVRLAPKQTVGYVGSHHDVVAVRLRRPRRFKVIVPIDRERVAISLEDPKGFLADLRSRIESF